MLQQFIIIVIGNIWNINIEIFLKKKIHIYDEILGLGVTFQDVHANTWYFILVV